MCSEFLLASLSLKPGERLTGFDNRAQYLAGHAYGERTDRFIAAYPGSLKLRRIDADAPEKLCYDAAGDGLFCEWTSDKFERVGIRQFKPARESGTRRLSKAQCGGLE